MSNLVDANLYGIEAERFSRDIPEAELWAERPDQGFDLVENTLPDGTAYFSVRFSKRNLKLYEAGRESMMTVTQVEIGAAVETVLTAQAWGTKFGKMQYAIRKDGLDHTCYVGTKNGEKTLNWYCLPGRSSTVNPELIDKYTSLLKMDRTTGALYRTIVNRRILNGHAEFVVEPKDSYERGVFLAGQAVQLGGWRYVRTQIKRVLSVNHTVQMLAGTGDDGVCDVIEFLGHMGCVARSPRGMFVVAENGWNEEGATPRILGIAIEPDGALNSWKSVCDNNEKLVAAGKVGVVLQTL